MKKIHDKVLIKKVRYDLNISVENASIFEQLCEAYNMKKWQMADFIIETFAKENPTYRLYLQNLEVTRKELKNKIKQTILKFTVQETRDNTSTYLQERVK